MSEKLVKKCYVHLFNSENKNPTILNMIGFRFIFDARLLIPGRINNESYVISTIDIRFKIKSPCCLIIITTLDLK